MVELSLLLLLSSTCLTDRRRGEGGECAKTMPRDTLVLRQKHLQDAPSDTPPERQRGADVHKEEINRKLLFEGLETARTHLLVQEL